MHWQNFLNNTMKSFSNLSKEIPETFKGFETMGKEAKKNGALDEKTKEFVQTNIVDANINLDALKYSPSYFQLYQKKDYEIRATFVSSEVFVVKIESLNEIDWRKSDNKITYSVCEMPDDIYNKCIKFMKLCKMDFGCFDFIVHNDSWYFLEMNVNGQWAWLEFETELDISGSIVRYLRGY